MRYSEDSSTYGLRPRARSVGMKSAGSLQSMAGKTLVLLVGLSELNCWESKDKLTEEEINIQISCM